MELKLQHLKKSEAAKLMSNILRRPMSAVRPERQRDRPREQRSAKQWMRNDVLSEQRGRKLKLNKRRDVRSGMLGERLNVIARKKRRENFAAVIVIGIGTEIEAGTVPEREIGIRIAMIDIENMMRILPDEPLREMTGTRRMLPNLSFPKRKLSDLSKKHSMIY